LKFQTLFLESVITLSSLQIWSIGLKMTNNSALIMQQVLVLVDELKLLKVEKTMKVFRQYNRVQKQFTFCLLFIAWLLGLVKKKHKGEKGSSSINSIAFLKKNGD